MANYLVAVRCGLGILRDVLDVRGVLSLVVLVILIFFNTFICSVPVLTIIGGGGGGGGGGGAGAVASLSLQKNSKFSTEKNIFFRRGWDSNPRVQSTLD